MYLSLKDIIRENALVFLPAKSLFRFKSVCRDWKYKIPTPFFAHSQSISFRSISGLFHQQPGQPLRFIPLEKEAHGIPDPTLAFLSATVAIRASCNGLVCCQALTGDKAYYICNPVTKQFKKLPKPEGNHGPDPAIVLIFEPSLFDFIADYKLVCAFPSALVDKAVEFEIYSSREGSWRISGEVLFGQTHLDPSSGVYVDGNVYWRQGNKSYGKYDYYGSGRLVAFDVKEERAQLISHSQGALGAMNGKLCAVSASGHGNLTVAMLHNPFQNTMGTMGFMANKARPYRSNSTECICVNDLGSGATVVFAGSDVVVFLSGSNLFSYDMKKKESKLLCSVPSSGTDQRFIPYVNSLVDF